MRQMLYMFILPMITSILLSACSQADQKQERFIESKNLSTLKVVPQTDCIYDSILSDPGTPKQAIALYNNTARYNEESLDYFDQLSNKDKSTRAFYFRVITNSYKIADGAYAEGLGNYGKEFIEHHSREFTDFFDNSNCFNDEDLKIWAKIVVLEFEIMDDNIETGKGKPLVDQYIEKLHKKSENYSKRQKEIIHQFCIYLRKEWGAALGKNG